MQSWKRELALLKEELEKYRGNITDYDIEINENTCIEEAMDSADLMNQAQQFFNEMQIQLHDVPILNKDIDDLLIDMEGEEASKYISALEKSYSNGEITEEIFLKEIKQIHNDFLNRICKITSPYHIPIEKDFISGVSRIQWLTYRFSRECFSQYIVIKFVKKILLYQSKDKRAYVPTLIHELVHSQLLYRDLVYDEVLPIFFELLYKNNKKRLLQKMKQLLIMLVETQQYDTISNAVSTFSIEVKSDLIRLYQKYIIGTIYAIGLYDIYQNGNILEKEKMMREIQAVFDSKQTVEDFLKRFDFGEQIEVVKQYCKKGVLSCKRGVRN